LIEIVRVLKLTRNIQWTKVAGHAGVTGNERVDEIATGFADKKFVLMFSGNFKDYTKMLGGDIFHIKEGADTKKKSSSSSAKAYSYVSFVDGVLSIDKTWAACEKRVKGKKSARFKKSFSKQDEDAIAMLFRSGKKS
jgi:ribonuclease HI